MQALLDVAACIQKFYCIPKEFEKEKEDSNISSNQV